ncbi:MAG: hypothetical protein R3Y07_05370 [Eubacteriales bacterium]
MKKIAGILGPVRLVLLLVICSILSAFTYQQFSLVEASHQYLQLNQGQISTYNMHNDHKIYYSPTQYKAVQINLEGVQHSPYLELMAGGAFHISCYLGDELVGEFSIDDLTRHVIKLPDSACTSGYDNFVLTPISGKILYVSYLSFLETETENLVHKEVTAREFDAFLVNSEGYYSQEGTSADVSGLFAYLVESTTTQLTLDMISTNEQLGCHLLQIINSDGAVIAKFEDNTFLPAYTENASELRVTLPLQRQNEGIAGLVLQYCYENSAEIKEWSINPFIQINDELYSGTEIRNQNNIDEFECLTVEGNTVKFNEKSVILDKSLFIPQGYQLIVEAGQFIDLQNNALLFCRDFVIFDGTEQNPIYVTSTDDSLYSGLVVMRGTQKSTLNYVNFDNLGEAQSGMWKLTGAVTFYESDVTINNCSFKNNRSEDGLNSVRCHIEVNDTIFENTFQDAYDSDFCTGSFINVTFIDSGNDGFDISTSTFYLENCEFYNTFDKAISTGESSQIEANGIYIDGAQSGLSAKDSSILEVKNATVQNVFIGICVYQKKPEFGPTTVIVDNYTLGGSYDFDYIIQEQDTVIVNGSQLIASNKQKENLIIERMIEEIEIT